MALSKSLKKRNNVIRKYKNKTRKYLKRKQAGGSAGAYIVIDNQIRAARDYQANALAEYINNGYNYMHQFNPEAGLIFYISKKHIRYFEDAQGNPMVEPDVYVFTREDGTSTHMSMKREALQRFVQ
jgi:hypothetical protein